ncbi:MAG: hypothetical protein SGJ27_08325 [Candidatus Melainabacteria bacterium]|nr:hypothetical protein [Candidatus Melainabacteria bacterium]
MSKFNFRPGMIAGFALIAVFALSLTGCKKEEVPEAPPAVTTPAQPKYVVKVIPKPDTSDELQRIYTYLPDGVTLVKLEIQYRQGGRTQRQLFRENGSVKEVQELHPYTTKLKSSTQIGADGTTRIAETTYRISGELDSKIEFKADGSSKTLRFRNGGSRLLAEVTTATDGTKTSVYFHPDGTTVWANTVESRNGDTKVETFRLDGTRDQSREVLVDRMHVTVYGADGKAQFKQTWSGYRSAYSSYRYYSLEKVEEFGADGTTVNRTLEFERYGNRNIKKASDIVSGKPSKVRTYRYDGTLESEEIFSADGTSKVERHESSENLKETHDPRVKVEPAFDDPLVDSPSHFN